MRLPAFLIRRLEDRAMRVAAARRPDFLVGGPDNPYLRRWYLIPRNPVFNIYLHQFLRDDDDRALHDHPWFWCSIVLRGEYFEHIIRAGGIARHTLRRAGSVRVASPWRAHRIELLPWWLASDDVDVSMRPPDGHVSADLRAPCRTLFVTGPRVRNWGFHCPDRGWVPWQEFTDPADSGAIGKGCAP